MAAVSPGYQFEHGGTTWTLPRQTIGDKKQWMLWAGAKAIANAREHQAAVDAGWMSEADYADLIETTKRRVAAGKYHPDIENELRWTDDGFAMLWLISMRRHDPRIALPDVAKLIASLGVEEALSVWKLANADPNRPAPQQGGATANTTPDGSSDGCPKSAESTTSQQSTP